MTRFCKRLVVYFVLISFAAVGSIIKFHRTSGFPFFPQEPAREINVNVNVYVTDEGQKVKVDLHRESLERALLAESPELDGTTAENDYIPKLPIRIGALAKEIQSAIRVRVETTQKGPYCDKNSTHPDCCSQEHCQLVQKSTIYSSCCDNVPTPRGKTQRNKLYPTLITATPQSGIKLMQSLIQELGGNIMHDWRSVHHGRDGMVSWMHIMDEPEEEWFGPAKLGGGKFYSVWHQLRDPLKALTSMTFSEPQQEPDYLHFLNRHIHVSGWCHDKDRSVYSKYHCLLRQNLEFYTQWHEFIQDLKVPTFRLEDLVEEPYDMTILDGIFQSMNLPPPNHTKALQILKGDDSGNGKKITKSRKHRPTLEWWELCQVDAELTAKFLQMSQSWGYYEDMHESPCDEVAIRHPKAAEELLEINPIQIYLKKRDDTKSLSTSAIKASSEPLSLSVPVFDNEPGLYCDRNSSHPTCCTEEHCQLVRRSTIYSACCGNIPNPDLSQNQKGKLYPMLITATPRSGTAFMEKLINKLNGNVTHDWQSVKYGRDGMVSWMHIRNDPINKWYGPAKLDGSKFYSVWHQLRDPLKGLTSMVFSEPMQKSGYLPFLRRHIPVSGWCYSSTMGPYDRYQCLLRQGLQFYNQWHIFLKHLKLRTFKLEDLVVDYNMTVLDEVFKSMNLPTPDHKTAIKLIKGDDKRHRRLAHTNSRKHRPTLEWWELCQVDRALTDQFLQLSKTFGYYEDVVDPCDAAAMNHPFATGDYLEIDSVGLNKVYCDRNSTHPSCCSEEQCQLVRQSTIYSACCGNLPNPSLSQGREGKLYPMLITATPRSGTEFMEKLINKLDGNVTHDWESVQHGTDGMVSWMHIRNDQTNKWYGPAKLDGSKFYSVWHQLRDPLKGLTSIAFSEPIQKDNYLPFLRRHIRVSGWCYAEDIAQYDQYQCLLRQGLQFYTQWHKYLIKLKLRTFKLEDLVEDYNMYVLDEIFDSMNLPHPDHEKAIRLVQGDGRHRRLAHTNSRKHRPTLEWWELCQVDKALTGEFLKLSKKFGYYQDVLDPCDDAAMSHPLATDEYLEIDSVGLKAWQEKTKKKKMAT